MDEKLNSTFTFVDEMVREIEAGKWIQAIKRLRQESACQEAFDLKESKQIVDLMRAGVEAQKIAIVVDQLEAIRVILRQEVERGITNALDKLEV